jgi:GNAT superfamily N-acetyltransferase
MIRAATVADARAIAELQTRAWFRAYEDIVDHQVMADRAEDREQRWIEHLTTDELSTTIVAEVDGQLAGFASYGPSRLGHAPPDEGELWALYVDPPAQGAGVGTQLLDAAVAALRAAGHTRAVLGVFEANGHARRFYEGQGWVWDGQPAIADVWAPEVHYRRQLS